MKKIRVLYWKAFWRLYGKTHRKFALAAAHAVSGAYLKDQTVFDTDEELEAFRAIIVSGYYKYFVCQRPLKLFPRMREVIAEIARRKTFMNENLEELSPWK